MTDECRIDCIDKLLFPKKLLNRPGLTRIDYRIGTYSDILEALHRKLNDNAALADWTHREADDPGIALLEGASILGDILTFYQEVYANEAYLRTAQWRESIADLVRLLGYRLSPGLGGKATFAFEVKGEKPVVIPAGFPVKAQLEDVDKAVDFETKKDVVSYPESSKFHLYRPLYTPEIDNSTNEFYIYSPDQYVESVVIEKGDRILIGDPSLYSSGPGLENSEIVIVDEIRNFHGKNLFKIKGKLQKRPDERMTVVGYKLGRSFRHFGHNAPLKLLSTTAYGKVNEETISYRRSLVSKTSSGTLFFHDVDFSEKQIVHPALSHLDFALDNVVDNLPTGSQMIISGTLYGLSSNEFKPIRPKEFTFVRTIVNINSRSMCWGAISGATTLLSFDKDESLMTLIESSDGSAQCYNTMDIRMVEFHEVISPRLQLRAALEETDENYGRKLYFFGTDDQVQNLKERQLLFEQQEKEAFTAYVTAVQSLDTAVSKINLPRRITLDQEVNYEDFPNEGPLVTVYGNLIEATQGKTEKEAILGNGDNREAFQTFKLPKVPLTYFISKDETPPEVPELEVYVNKIKWERVSSFFGYGPKEEIYIVREDEKTNSWIQFGDGKTGARLPSGIKNVVARYRTGTGAYGPIKKDASAQAGKQLNGVKKIHLPGAASGGAKPETGENAKEAAPGKIQGLGRLVSLKDYETEILAIAGVVKAAASWQLKNNIPTIVLTVLMESGRQDEESTLRETMQKYARNRGPQRYPISIQFAKWRSVLLNVTCGIDPRYREEDLRKQIKNTLGLSGEEGNGVDGSNGLFSMKHRQFGQPVYATRIEGTLQIIKGVVWVDVTNLWYAPGLIFGTYVVGISGNRSLSCDTDELLYLHTDHFDLVTSEIDVTEVPSDG